MSNSGFFSIPGPKGHNQDTVLPPVLLDGVLFAAVADGVGGQADGKLASETATNAISEFLRQSPRAPLAAAFSEAQRALAEVAERFPLSRTMATTLSVVRVDGTSADVAHVGDSRVYHLRGHGLVSRTEDQTEVAELVRQKVFTKEEALRYPRRNVLLSSLSPSGIYTLFEASFGVQPKDLIVVCSDGLYNAVRKGSFIEAAAASQDADDFLLRLRQALERNGHRDDASIAAALL